MPFLPVRVVFFLAFYYNKRCCFSAPSINILSKSFKESEICMNQKEIAELRRRFKPEKSAVSRIYGCYVNSKKEVISYLANLWG